MKIKLLANTVEGGRVTARQHFTCFVVDGTVAIDAGSLASGTGNAEKERICDIVLTHAHLDHIAGLPLFIDDLFDKLEKPVRVHATGDVIEILENDVFNWRVYPRFSELENRFGAVLEYVKVTPERPFRIGDIDFEAVEVNHKVPTVGYLVTKGESTVAITGDTAEMGRFWEKLNSLPAIGAVLIECAFPDRLADLARVSHHLTPNGLKRELDKFKGDPATRFFAINLKPMYRNETLEELEGLGFPNLAVLEAGREYDFGQ